MSGTVLLNGQPADPALALSRGLHYGDGIFRTLLKYNSQLIDFKLQYIKLTEDAAALGLEAPDLGMLQREAEGVGAAVGNGVIKILLLRSGAGRGYTPRTSGCDRLLLSYPLPRYPLPHWQEGIEACRCELRLARQPALAGIKHLNRLEQVLAARNWPEGAVEGILCDERGAPVCGTRSNLFWIRDGVLHTPALESCGVAGMMRGKVLACAAALGIATRVETRPWSVLMDAAEAFVTNSLIGIWPLRRLGQRDWGEPGPLTHKLRTALQHPCIACDPDQV
ncbi:MAG: aminodeoxychorismate lyase [Nevskia sp.]|nr:aminodeoxychorismate lyase [Nevskia sp.]